jgi:hypothetical protein
MGGGEVEMGEGIFLLEVGMIHLVVVRILVEDIVEDRAELEDPGQAQTLIAAAIATLICFLELEVIILERKGVLEVEIIPPEGGIISPTGVVLEMVEIIPPTILGIIYHSRRRIWPSIGENRDILGETTGKVIMVSMVSGVMKNLMMRMMNTGVMMKNMGMIMRVMVMRNLMMKAWMIKIQEGIRKAKMEINQAIGLVITAGRIMRKIEIRRKIGNMGMKGVEVGKIGLRTE